MRSLSPHPVRRTVAGLAVLTATVAALSACRTSPGVAAYVGGEVITTPQLDAAVQEGLSNESVADLYDGRIPEYRRIVLQELVATEVYDAAAERYDVAVSEANVSAFLDAELAQSGDPDAFFDQQAIEGRTEANVREQVRRFLLNEQIATAIGLDAATSDAALRELYEQTRGQYGEYELGIISVPDQATADAVLAQLTADPASYADVAANYPNPNTFAAPESGTAEQLTGIGVDPALLAPGQGFSDALLPTGEITVVFIFAITYPEFEDLRATLEQQVRQEQQTAIDAELQAVRESLDITVNPRYGTFDDSGSLVPDDRGVVSVIDDAEETAAVTGLN